MKTRREKIREATIEEIKLIAWEMLRQNQAVTIHRITKKMGMTAPAFYTYFKNRDALMSQLAEDALDSFYQAISKKLNPDSHIAERIFTTFIRYRDWAVDNPNAFSLFAGTKAVDFSQDNGPLQESARKNYDFIFDLFARAEEEGKIKTDRITTFSKAYLNQLDMVKSMMNTPLSISGIHQVITLISLVHGLISMELSGRFSTMVGDFDQIYTAQVNAGLSAVLMDYP